MSIATALTALAGDVSAAKAAITAKGGTAPNGTAGMADAIAAIPSGGITPTGKITITENGTDIDVAQYALADVNVSGATPEYVTDGLIAMYDAIDNTRSGHNASYAGWQDISGNGHDLTHEGGNPPIIGDNFYYLSNCWLDGAAIGNAVHVDIVTQLGVVALLTVLGMGVAKDNFGDAFSHNPTTYGSGNGTKNSMNHTAAAKLFSAAFEDDKIWAYCDSSTASASSKFDFDPTNRLYLGARKLNDTYACHDYICAIRIYNRALTIEEAYQNFVADVYRFGSNGSGFTLDELFNALPTVTTAHTIKVNAAEKAAASAETLAIATGKGWTVA